MKRPTINTRTKQRSDGTTDRRINTCAAVSSHHLTASSSRRGVSSVLSMMFLVLFGSLAAAMAVVAHGNLRTADSSLRVSRAMSAAETGLVFATKRLSEETERFIITKGDVDGVEKLVERLWIGEPHLSQHGSVLYIQDNGEVSSAGNFGIAHAVLEKHLSEAHNVTPEPGDQNLPTLDGQFGTLHARPIALSALPDGSPDPDGPYFRLKYELLPSSEFDEHGHVRITSQGVFGDIRRTLETNVRISKKIEFALLSPNRIMIGKNVIVDGPIGALYGADENGTVANELQSAHGHPLRMHSDFYHLNDSLDADLDLFHDLVLQYDVAGDGRLRPNHPEEGAALSGTGFFDFTGDGYVSDFDLFMIHYANADGVVVYDSDLSGMAVNFTDDPALARLIDFANPDRDGDGEITSADHALGYADGIIDWRDNYAKVHGHLSFAVKRSDWETLNPQLNSSYQEVVHGPINSGPDDAPVSFEVSPIQLFQIATDMLDSSQSWFAGQAQDNFESQASSTSGTIICPPHDPDDPPWDVDDPPWWVDVCVDGSEDEWEGVPYDSPSPYDYYPRPIFEGFTFHNVRIPKGLNALFENCTFVGVTYVETTEDNTHINWNLVGAVDPDGEDPPNYHERFPTLEVEIDGETYRDTRQFSNNIRFHDCTFLGSIAGDTPQAYTHWRNKIQMTGETRFYLDPFDEDLLEQDDAATLQSHLLSISESDREELAKSSILMPSWSMDVGSFQTDPDADPSELPIIKLRGTIIAGILDIRGRADIHGTLLMTFRPEIGEQPLVYMPPDCSDCLASFSTTIGYFGPQFADFEAHDTTDPDFEGFGEIRLRYDPDAKLPDGIPWPVRMDAVPDTYNEGGSM